jgi:Adenylate cyclase regulatory domain
MTAESEFTGLIAGLEGQARQEREDLARWLLDRGFNAINMQPMRAVASYPVLLGVLQSEANFQGHLEVCDGPVPQVATDRLHFEPIE